MSLARILIVEDEFITAQGLQRSLMRLGYEAEEIATSGEEAVDRARELRPDLVLMDIMLGGEMDGIKAAEKIRTEFGIPIVYLTALDDKETLARAKRTEPLGYLLKPFGTKMLQSTLEMALYKHRAETNLRKSERRYRSLFDRVPIGLYRTTAQGQILDANPALVKMLGYPDRDSLLATTTTDLYKDPEDRLRWQAQLEQEGELHSFEAQFHRHDGSIIWLSDNAHAVRDTQGEVLYYEGSLEEITERKRTDKILQRRATQLALLNNVGSRIAATLEMDEIMGRAAQLIHETFDYHHVAIFTLDRERNEMVMRAKAGDFGHLFPPEHHVALDQGLVGWTTRRGETTVANDVAADPRYINFFPDLVPTKAELCAPIWVEEQVVGVLDVQSPQHNAFDENDVLVMETLATQIAVAVQNAHLHDRVQQELAERRRTEEALQESAKNLAMAQRIAHIGSWKYNVQAGELYWSDELFRIYGLNPEETEASLDHGMGMIHPDDRAFSHEAFRKAMEEGLPYNIEYRILRADGTERFVQGIGKIERDEEGGISSIYGTGQDITERKQAEEALRESLKTSKEIVEAIPAGLFIYQYEPSDRLILLDGNPESARLTGIRAEEWRGKEFNEIWPEARATGVTQAFLKVIETGETFETEELDYADERLAGAFRIRAFNMPGQRLGVAFENITEQKRAEEERERLYQDLQQRMAELRETQSQLIQSAKLAAVGELAAGVAHELNNPLTSIIGFSELLLWDAAHDDGAREDLKTIISEADRARTIVRNLLAFARQVKSHPAESDLNQVVQETLALVRHHVESDGIEIVEQYAADLPLLQVDAGRMKQVFLNLINNAHQATPQGGRLILTSQQVGDELAIQIQDTGKGIPGEHLDQIFDPFFTTKPVGQGTGLGLSVSLGIVRDHGGRIEVESQAGQGSTFTVWLPIQSELKPGGEGEAIG
ncbi:MAG: PAS domain S-box protein [Anaerolineae bacterium]|jgi:PAS domain S-box-containing protein